MLPLDRPPSAAFGLMLGLLGHAVGWPLPRGGSQRIADALASYLRSLGGEIETGHRVESLAELGDARAVLLDVTPRGLLALAGDRLPSRYRRGLERYRYGPGVFKLDWALDGPIPWQAEECARAATVHLGGTLEEIAASEVAPGRGGIAERPYVLLAQQSLFDPTRAPAGQHTAWAYCHVPNGSTVDMTERIEAQVERFAPGFRERILARSALGPAEMERYNANYVGGDINGGAATLSPALHASRRPGLAVHDAAAGSLPLLRLDAAGRRRPRHVRLSRRPRGAPPDLGLLEPELTGGRERLFLGLARDGRPERLLPEEPRERERHERQRHPEEEDPAERVGEGVQDHVVHLRRQLVDLDRVELDAAAEMRGDALRQDRPARSRAAWRRSCRRARRRTRRPCCGRTWRTPWRRRCPAAARRSGRRARAPA